MTSRKKAAKKTKERSAISCSSNKIVLFRKQVDLLIFVPPTSRDKL